MEREKIQRCPYCGCVVKPLFNQYYCIRCDKEVSPAEKKEDKKDEPRWSNAAKKVYGII